MEPCIFEAKLTLWQPLSIVFVGAVLRGMHVPRFDVLKSNVKVYEIISCFSTQAYRKVKTAWGNGIETGYDIYSC